MKKELDRYDMIVGLGEYDEWSYCSQDEMWYEDLNEILPEPLTSPDVVSDFACKIKVDYFNYPESTWEEAHENNRIVDYVNALIDGDLCDDVVSSVILFKSEKFNVNTVCNQYGIWDIDDFAEKVKNKEFATQYVEQYGSIKLFAWDKGNGQVRFTIQSYNHEFNYLKILFDIIIDKDKLISKLENIVKIWKETILNTIKKQELILKKPCTNPYHDNAINHFFPEYRTSIEKIINSEIKYYERNGIKVLFAIENGSRAWNMASKNSDYDVRFVFKRKPEEYISLNKGKEVLQIYYNEERRQCKAEDALIDMVGFDLIKYMQLLSKSNPTAIEWLMSDIVYYGSNDLSIKQYITENFNPKKLIYHYVSICKKHYDRYIKENKKVTHKMYLYMMRGLLNALYVYKKDSIPPLDFTKTIELLKDDIPIDTYNKVKEIIKIKSLGLEKDTIDRIEILDKYIEENISKTFEIPERQMDNKKLNDFLQDEILKKW